MAFDEDMFQLEPSHLVWAVEKEDRRRLRQRRLAS
jgi:hypothetical protein